MNKAGLRSAVRREVCRWSAKSISQLLQELANPLAYETEFDGQAIQVEVEVLEQGEDWVHVLVSVSDQSMLRSIVPASQSFMIRADDRDT